MSFSHTRSCSDHNSLQGTIEDSDLEAIAGNIVRPPTPPPADYDWSTVYCTITERGKFKYRILKGQDKKSFRDATRACLRFQTLCDLEGPRYDPYEFVWKLDVTYRDKEGLSFTNKNTTNKSEDKDTTGNDCSSFMGILDDQEERSDHSTPHVSGLRDGNRLSECPSFHVKILDGEKESSDILFAKTDQGRDYDSVLVLSTADKPKEVTKNSNSERRQRRSSSSIDCFRRLSSSSVNLLNTDCNPEGGEVETQRYIKDLRLFIPELFTNDHRTPRGEEGDEFDEDPDDTGTGLIQKDHLNNTNHEKRIQAIFEKGSNLAHELHTVTEGFSIPLTEELFHDFTGNPKCSQDSFGNCKVRTMPSEDFERLDFLEYLKKVPGIEMN